jgi:hypothetical protein
MADTDPDLIAETVRSYQKRPVVIEAMEYQPERIHALWDWAGADVVYGPTEETDSAFIETLEGRMEARPGDFIIRGIKGEFYPCKPDIFAASYELIDGPEPCDHAVCPEDRCTLIDGLDDAHE